MSNEALRPRGTDEQEVLAEVCEMLNVVLDDVGGADMEIGMDTEFVADLDLESIDLVALSVQLQEHYGERVNFAEFMAGFEVDELIELRVGQLVTYITRSFADSGKG